jgi:phosphoglycerate dehydrogenase-like enzyme
MKVLLAFDPSDEDWPLIHNVWPKNIEPIILPKENLVSIAVHIPEISAIIGPMRGAGIEIIKAAKKLKLVHTLGHGVDVLLQPDIKEELTKRNINVCRSNSAGIAIAEFNISNMISLSRRTINIHNRLVQNGDWSTQLKANRSKGVLGGELWESTLGLIGYGNIGKETALRAHAFGMKIGALIRTKKSDPLFDFQEFELANFLPKCDYVVITAPLTDRTRNIINSESIELMKNGAYLLNISRGPIINEGALHHALTSGKLAGAALDVFEVEEEGGVMSGYPSKFDFSGQNVIFTPHLSGATRETRVRAMTVIGGNLQRLIDESPLANVVNLNDEY